MADRVTQEIRGKIMAAVGTRGTGPEMTLRRALHRLGYRYRIGSKSLPGKPDLAFPSRKRVVFVHGCFWHGHRCRHGRLPKSRIDYWKPKIEGNRKLVRKHRSKMRLLVWPSALAWLEFDHANVKAWSIRRYHHTTS